MPIRLHTNSRPLVIAHRGASGYRPEHTLAAYALAARMGADCIEPDLVATRDGVLVARHENEISGTTDVAQRPEFADRQTTKEIDGRSVTGWFVEDFTLAEVQSLRAVERLPAVRPGNTTSNGVWGIPTFAEILQLRASLSAELGREIIVYPELKHPTYLRSCGLASEEMIVEELGAHDLVGPDVPVYIQCFEPATLTHLRQTCGVESPLLHLMSSAQSWSAGDLRTWAVDADGIGPDKTSIIARTDEGDLGEPTGLVEAAHTAGLFVHPYTFRAENQFLPRDLRVGDDPAGHGRLAAEITAYLEAGIDGFFTDHVDLGVAARDVAL
ncbi:MAG: glycerophosphodiester phosphodiesterase family protein [Ornithinimicrobium sp.]